MNVSPRVMTDETCLPGTRTPAVTRRRFVGITLASGAAILAGKSDVILELTRNIIKHGYNPTFNLGGDFTINRLGFGAMRVTGEASGAGRRIDKKR